MILAFTLSALLSATASGDELEVKGVHLGSTIDEVRFAWSINLEPADGLPYCSERLCRNKVLAFADTRLEASAVVNKGKVCAIYGEFPSFKFELVKASFLNKYGAPTSTEKVEKRNAFNAVFVGEQLIWANGKNLLTIDQVATGMNTSSISLKGEPCDKATVSSDI